MKKISKTIIPPFCFILFNLIKGIGGFLSLQKSTKAQFKSHQGESLIIIGNGPSLTDTINLHVDKLKKNNCMTVNFFANTDLFAEIQPSSYLLIDPAFFKDPNILSEDLKSKVLQLICSFTEKVFWEMTLYLPISANKSFLFKEIKRNKHIRIVFFNNKGEYHTKLFPSFNYWLWNHNCIAPLAQTVLNSCLTLAITMHYSYIYIVGADTSWHEDYWMDQKTNDLYTKDKHSYGKEKCRLYKDVAHKSPTRIHEEFLNVSKALESYWTLAEYATYNKVKVYNASEYSWIDAFERKSL